MSGLLTKASLLSKFSPYMLYLKLAFTAFLFLSGLFVGCRMDEPDCSVSDRARAELIAENATLRAANAEYDRVEKARNAQVAAQKGAQQQAEAQAQVEVAAAQRRAQSLSDKLRAIEERQRKAALDPKCADIMELQVCKVLR